MQSANAGHLQVESSVFFGKRFSCSDIKGKKITFDVAGKKKTAGRRIVGT
jgi:hypothetical protein